MSKRLRGFLVATLGLAALIVLALVLVVVFGTQGGMPVAQGPYPLGTPQPPTRTAESPPMVSATPGAYPPPQPTPVPTPPPTPLPTPTVLPAPVLKAVPVPKEVLAGDMIAFIRDKDLWLLNVDSRVAAPATASGNVEWLFGWSYDRSKLLLGVGKWVLPETDAPSGTDLWIINADGTEPLRLTKDLEVSVAIWSPIDNRIAYGTRDGKIHLINSDGTSYRALLADSISYLGPWSPDGSRIAYRELTPDYGTVRLMVLDLVDGSRRQLAAEGSFFVGYLYSFDVQWSLDGRRMLFQSHEPKPNVWWTVDADGSNLTHLDTETLRSVLAYSKWAPRSPTADRVVFSTYDSSSNEVIWMMDFKDQAQEVTKGSFPVWSPKGDRIAYVGEDGGLWMIPIGSRDAKQLTANGSQPHWSN